MNSILQVSDLSVLVVEDDEINQDVAVELLDQIGVGSVHLALNGLQGLKKLKQLDKIHVILVDIYMPDMDGIEFIGELAKLGFKGKVILVSGVSVETLILARQFAKDSGVKVIAAMEKPLQKQNLQQAMRLVFSGVSAQS